MYSTANLTDKELKEQGNRMYSLRKYDEAIKCYSKAIVTRIFFKLETMLFDWVIFR